MKHVTRRGLTTVAAAARLLVESLLPNSVETAWHIRFCGNRPFASRYRLIRQAFLSLGERSPRLPGADDERLSPADIAYSETLWWTAICQLDLATEWHLNAGTDKTEARAAVLEASGDYLRIIRDEPRKRSLETFLNLLGTSAEGEVERILTGRQGLAAGDEAIRKAFVTWYLGRYSVWRAWNLAKPFMRTQRKVALLPAALAAAAVLMFLFHTGWQWQAACQLTSLLTLTFLVPDVFRHLMPRALFGSLLAWMTIVTAQAVSVFSLSQSDDSKRLRGVCHTWLRDSMSWPGGRQFFTLHISKPSQALTLLVLASWTLSVIFVANTVTARAFIGRRALVLRSVSCLFVMFVGSLFWGMLLADPIRYILELGLGSFGFDCRCSYGVLLVGSSFAVLFGIMVQLLWDEHSLADPMGDET